MPTYEYACDHCGHAFEKFQRITEDPLKRCPKCAPKVKRLVGRGAGIIFRGSGFYQTDYRSDSYKKGATKEGSTVAVSKSESTPAKAESKAK